MQIPEAYETIFDTVESSFSDQAIQVAGFDVSVALKSTEDTPSLPCRSFEIDHEPSPARLQDPPDLVCALPARLGAKVMEHHCGQHDIEVFVRIGQRFDDSFTEFNLSAGFGGLFPCPGDHLGRGIDSTHDSSGADILFGGNRERTRSASDIKHPLAGAKARQLNQSFPKGSLFASHHEPDKQVVRRSPMKNQASRLELWSRALCCCHLCRLQRTLVCNCTRVRK